MKKIFCFLFLIITLTQCVSSKNNVNKYKYYNVEMVLGLENIENNRDLNKKDENGVKVLDELYQYVNPSNTSGYVNRFKPTKQNNIDKGLVDFDYGIIYLKNENNDVISMIAGPIDIQNGRFTILNTATLKSEQKKGWFGKLFKSAVFKLYENNFKVVDIFLDTEVAKNEEIVIDNNLKKEDVKKRFKNVVGKNLACPIIKSMSMDKENIALINEITNRIEEGLSQKQNEGKTNNFAVFNRLVGNNNLLVELDDKDIRFNDYYIKPYIEINIDNVVNFLKKNKNNKKNIK